MARDGDAPTTPNLPPSLPFFPRFLPHLPHTPTTNLVCSVIRSLAPLLTPPRLVPCLSFVFLYLLLPGGSGACLPGSSRGPRLALYQPAYPRGPIGWSSVRHAENESIATVNAVGPVPAGVGWAPGRVVPATTATNLWGPRFVGAGVGEGGTRDQCGDGGRWLRRRR